MKADHLPLPVNFGQCGKEGRERDGLFVWDISDLLELVSVIVEEEEFLRNPKLVVNPGGGWFGNPGGGLRTFDSTTGSDLPLLVGGDEFSFVSCLFHIYITLL